MRSIFIVGSSFCGSTIIGNTLNSHSQVFHAGEVDRLSLFRRYHGADETYLLNSCGLCGLDDKAHCPVWDDLPPPPATPQEAVSLYRTLMARGGKEVALDGSKNVDWLAYLHDHGLRNAGAILLSRNPLAFAKSHRDATGAPVWQGVEIWRNIYNHTLRSLITRQIPFISMRHADLTSNPQGFYARLLEFMGLDGMVDVEQYFQFPVHALGGNVGAFVRYRDFNAQRYEAREAQNKRPLGVMEIEEKQARQKRGGTWRDTAWMQSIPDAEAGAALNLPGVADTMSLLGYSAYELFMAKQKWRLTQSPRTLLRDGVKLLRSNRTGC
ncbi:sulfotransferase [Acidocella sp.]|uniref:sulfotransferase n=1 Tax=Acidocella sp. TaxID=50710 RepID=UPI0026221F2B|nr:sulfotransferase [Acidocella sp.]